MCRGRKEGRGRLRLPKAQPSSTSKWAFYEFIWFGQFYFQGGIFITKKSQFHSEIVQQLAYVGEQGRVRAVLLLNHVDCFRETEAPYWAETHAIVNIARVSTTPQVD